jgi:hypothetical protein
MHVQFIRWRTGRGIALNHPAGMMDGADFKPEIHLLQWRSAIGVKWTGGGLE